MEFLTDLPPHPVCKMLDSMLEDDQIDLGTYVVAYGFGDRDALSVIQQEIKPTTVTFNGTPFTSATSASRGAFAPLVLDVADFALNVATPEVRGAAAYLSLKWLQDRFDGYGDFLAEWAYQDALVGGCVEPFRKGRDRAIDKHGRAYTRTERRPRSPDFVRRYVKRCPTDILPLRRIADRLLTRVAQAPFLSKALTDYSGRLALMRSDARDAEIREYFLEVKPSPQARREKRVKRARIKRALRLAQSVLPQEKVRAFVHGEPVRLEGQTMDLIVRAQRSLASLGHGCLDVGVAARGGDRLADLCTYIENTPTLDQFAAFSLAMQAGDEADVVAKANVIEYLPGSEAHPLLASKKALAPPRPEPIDLAEEGRDLVVRIHAAANSYWRHKVTVEEQTAAYCRDMRGLFTERIEVAACGPRVKLYRQGIKAMEAAA